MHAGIHPPRGANNPTPSGPPSPPSNPSPTISKLARRPQSASSGRSSCDRASSATSSPGASASCSGGIESTPRTVERQLVVGLVVAEQRRQVGIEAHYPAKRVRERQSAGQRVGQQPERFTVGSGEAAHLFNRLGARTLKMSPVKRRRAGRLDVGARASSLTLDLHAVGLTAVHSHVGYCGTATCMGRAQL